MNKARLGSIIYKALMTTLICPHCTNDDKSSLDAIEWELNGKNPTRFFCNNCAKTFNIKETIGVRKNESAKKK